MSPFLTLILSMVFQSSAEAQHLYGSGIMDRETHAILTLKCVDEQADVCTQVQWQVTLSRDESIDLGNAYLISQDVRNEYEAYLQLDGLGVIGEGRDLEDDGFARKAFQQYINGFAKHARKNFKKEGWIRFTNKVFWEGKDISASHFADGQTGNSRLQGVADKNGWNWSSKTKVVSHDYFSNMIQLVAMRALESAQKRSIQGEVSLKNYVETIRSERATIQMLRRSGLGAAVAKVETFSNGESILNLLDRLGIEP